MKKVCVQGLGFVGAAMSTAIALATDDNGEPLYDVIGIDLPNELGQYRVDAINSGKFPFSISDDNLISSIECVFKQGNFKATTDNNIYSSADIVVVDIQFMTKDCECLYLVDKQIMMDHGEYLSIKIMQIVLPSGIKIFEIKS